MEGQVQSRADSEPEISAEAHLLGRRMEGTTVHPGEAELVTIREVKPVLIVGKVQDAGVFLDLSDSVVRPTNWGAEPELATCPSCATTDLTKTQTVLSRSTLFFEGVLCFTCGLCVLAALCPCCKDTEHYCRKCGCSLGCRSAL